MKFFLMALALLMLSSCTSILVKDCEQQGGSQYYHCKRVLMLTQK